MFSIIFLAALVKGIYELSRYRNSKIHPLTRQQRTKTYHFSKGYDYEDYEEPEPQEETELDEELEEQDTEYKNKWYKLFQG